MKAIVRALVASTIVAIVACSTPAEEKVAEAGNQNEVSLTAEQAANIDLQTGQVSRGKISQTLRLQGRIDVPPQNLVSVSVPLGGYLRSTSLLPGMQVRKGQVIAEMEDPQYIQLQQDYLSVKNKLDYADKELARQRELNQTKAGSDKVLQVAEAEHQNLKIELMALTEKLKVININAARLGNGNLSRRISVYSPIDGFVIKVNVNTGKYVTPSEAIMELIDPAGVHLNLTVFERDLQRVKIGQQVAAFTNAEPDIKYAAEVILISPSLNEGGNGEVHCHFRRYDKSLVPGMYMNAELNLKDEEGQFLPEDAVVSWENRDYVFVETGARTYRMVEVSAGALSDNRISVSGNFDDKKIVVKGAYSLLMKMKNTSEEE